MEKEITKETQIDSRFVDGVIIALREAEALLVDLRSDLHTHYGFAKGYSLEENRQNLNRMMDKITRYLNRKAEPSK